MFFLLSVLAFVFRFVGYAIAPGDQWLRFYFSQYHLMAYFFLLSFAVVYVVIDSLFTDFWTFSKYSLAFLIVGSTFTYYYNPFFANPRHLYTTQDVADYKAVNQAVIIAENMGKTIPTVQEIAAISSIGIWKNGVQVGVLFDDQKARRVAELLPYSENDENFGSLLFKPLYFDNIYMNVLCIIFIFLFFGYQYKNDPPQGAYIEKIIFLFLPYCSLEILHHYAYIKSVEYATFVDVQQIGYYLTLLNLLFLLTFFGLRLRFITSVKGEFYERELVSDAEHISRWRDALDNLVVRHFLNPKAIHGRLFAPRAPRNEA
ncbi:MAG: hypothetical protein NTU47_18335 [Ignavibacteriales bacterium]|nr:hypothetical protein [Ignavibacteriales bacterium]